jgi:hypothetical protein
MQTTASSSALLDVIATLLTSYVVVVSFLYCQYPVRVQIKHPQCKNPTSEMLQYLKFSEN